MSGDIFAKGFTTATRRLPSKYFLPLLPNGPFNSLRRAQYAIHFLKTLLVLPLHFVHPGLGRCALLQEAVVDSLGLVLQNGLLPAKSDLEAPSTLELTERVSMSKSEMPFWSTL
jgi:hypothetical protein